MLLVCPLLDQSSFHCSPEKTSTQNELQAGLTTEFNVRCRRRREVIAFDLATKLTGGDGDTAMDEDRSLAQQLRRLYPCAGEMRFLPARRLLRSTTKAPCSLAANRVLVDNGRWLVRFQFSTATAFSSRVFKIFFGLPAMASCSIAAASRAVECTNRPNRF